MKTVIVKVFNAKEQVNEVKVVTNDGQVTKIAAQSGVNYEFFDNSIGAAPNHIITKRVGNDLHVSFEDEGQETDLIVENFYNESDQAIIGMAEDGNYYNYIPDTGETSDYVTKLLAGEIEGQALGGDSHITPFWLPLVGGLPGWVAAAGGLLLAGAVAGAAGGGNGGNGG